MIIKPVKTTIFRFRDEPFESNVIRVETEFEDEAGRQFLIPIEMVIPGTTLKSFNNNSDKAIAKMFDCMLLTALKLSEKE